MRVTEQGLFVEVPIPDMEGGILIPSCACPLQLSLKTGTEIVLNKKTLSRKTATILETVNLCLMFSGFVQETCDDQVIDLEMMKILKLS